jgi:hypothetical protein
MPPSNLHRLTPRELKKKRKPGTSEGSQAKKEEKDHRGAFVLAPPPIVSPAIGSGIIPVLGYIFPFQMKDQNSPLSVVGAAGLITGNGTRAFALGTDIYFKQTSYELKSLYFHGNLDYNLYGVEYENGNAGLKLPLEQSGQLFFIQFLRRIPWKLFVGGRFITGTSLITIEPRTSETPPIPPNTGLQTNFAPLA